MECPLKDSSIILQDRDAISYLLSFTRCLFTWYVLQSGKLVACGFGTIQ